MHGCEQMPESLTEWLDGFIPGRYATPAAFAKTLGWTQATFDRGRRLGTYDAENLLHLAHVTGESATRVLTMGGKDRLAALIERAYGPSKPSESPAVRDVVQQLEALDPELRDQFAELFARMLRVAGGAGQTAKPSAGAHPAPVQAAAKRPHMPVGRSRGVSRAAGKR